MVTCTHLPYWEVRRVAKCVIKVRVFSQWDFGIKIMIFSIVWLIISEHLSLIIVTSSEKWSFHSSGRAVAIHWLCKGYSLAKHLTFYNKLGELNRTGRSGIWTKTSGGSVRFPTVLTGVGYVLWPWFFLLQRCLKRGFLCYISLAGYLQ